MSHSKQKLPAWLFHCSSSSTTHHIIQLHFLQAQEVVYEPIIWPDHVSCFVCGAKWVSTTSTAWNFWFFGGMGQILYVTTSPSTGTYSPSMLKKKKKEHFRALNKNMVKTNWCKICQIRHYNFLNNCILFRKLQCINI